jgi:hypothetical protein
MTNGLFAQNSDLTDKIISNLKFHVVYVDRNELLKVKIVNESSHTILLNKLSLEDPLINATIYNNTNNTKDLGSALLESRGSSPPLRPEKIKDTNILRLKSKETVEIALSFDSLLQSRDLVKEAKARGSRITMRLVFLNLVVAIEETIDNDLFNTTFYSDEFKINH